MKKLLMLGLSALLVTGLAMPAIADQPAVPTGPLKMELTKKPVTFDHASHKDVKCGECHHPVDGKENYQKCATAGCHDVLGSKDKTVHSYYRIAHDKKAKFDSCLGCHVKVAGTDKDLKKKLTGCAGSACHK